MPKNNGGKTILIDNKSNHTYCIKNYKIKPESSCVVQLHYSAGHNTKHTLKGRGGHKNLEFKLDLNGHIHEHSANLSLIDTQYYINIDKSTGTGTGFYWKETNVSPIYIEPRTRLCIN